MTAPVGVLVMAHGTPDRAEQIAPFYTRIRRGRPPSDEQLADLTRRYEAIGGLSPLTERTAAQVDGVRRALDARAPGQFVVAYGSKHASPLIEEGVAELLAAGVHSIVGLVLTPHASSMGSGEYLARAREAAGSSVAVIEPPPWFGAPALVAVLAERVRSAVGALDRASTVVVFTAHSLPARIVDQGDTYPEQLAASAELVAHAAGLADWQVAWQSAGRTPEPWLGPDVRAVMTVLAERGDVDGVVVCPIGFVADHLEVLYDLDVEAAAVATASGLAFARTTSLNDDPVFTEMLADVVISAAGRSS